jgi:hypothetical protein
VRAGGEVSEQLLGDVPPGESSHEVFVPAIEQPGAVEFALLVGDAQADLRVIPWQPPRRLTVHVIQRSHHDVGYTNLASTVLREYDGFLDQVIDMAEHTRGFPEESQFRMAVEQAWSIDHFLRHARPERAAKMIALMQSGRVELTALFGNMVTEICGHESLIRALYHARRLARLHGISITTAEHNDVPGMSWGLCQVLTDAGIKLFCPMLPRYYNWGEKKMRSFWDDETLFSAYGQPGAFWWEAPSGKRLLLLDNAGAWGDMNGSLPGLADKLTELVVKGYPYDTVRWPVIGGARDNSPYIEGYAHSIKAWNEKWAWPRLICSTNARFYADFAPELPGDLPVFRGELPGQDYPTGSTSTAADTAVSRNTHVSLMTAERLAATAASATGYLIRPSSSSRHTRISCGMTSTPGATTSPVGRRCALRAWRRRFTPIAPRRSPTMSRARLSRPSPTGCRSAARASTSLSTTHCPKPAPESSRPRCARSTTAAA